MKSKQTEDCVSRHIFMFPFTISPKRIGKRKTVDLSDIYYSAVRCGWEYKPFEPKKSPENYNEYVYFHKYIREALFESKPRSQVENIFKREKNPVEIVSYYFEKQLGDEGKMVLRIRPSEYDPKRLGPYELAADRLSMRIFEFGVGVVTLQLINRDYGELIDILCINDFARRLYPQFLGSGDDSLDAVKQFFLPEAVEFQCDGMSWEAPFEPEDYAGNEIRIAEYMRKLIGEEFEFECEPAIDDRMYTMCWYGNDEFSKMLTKVQAPDGDPLWTTSSDWYKFIFIDGRNIGCASERMKKSLIRKHTYDRWGDRGTLFGITRYSLVCLSDRSFFNVNVLRGHMETMYCQIAVLLLAQRASIANFSRRVTRISIEIETFVKQASAPTAFGSEDRKRRFQNIAENVKKLHSAYIRFVNRLWFEEVTPQEQGIELYSMAQEATGLSGQVAELKREIQELFDFVHLGCESFEIERERKMNQEISKLNIVAARFIPITIAIGAISVIMNLGEVKEHDIEVIGLIFLLIWFVVIRIFRWIEKTEFQDQKK